MRRSESAVVDRFGDRVFSRDGSTVDEIVAGLLLGPPVTTVAVAESCTGGLMAGRLTDRAGSSAYVLGGVVVYSNEAKVAFADVPAELIASVGAVSPEVAAALADGARARFGADVGIGITGIAGPGGGTPEKPVGMVCVCVSGAGDRDRAHAAAAGRPRHRPRPHDHRGDAPAPAAAARGRGSRGGVTGAPQARARPPPALRRARTASARPRRAGRVPRDGGRPGRLAPGRAGRAPPHARVPRPPSGDRSRRDRRGPLRVGRPRAPARARHGAAAPAAPRPRPVRLARGSRRHARGAPVAGQRRARRGRGLHAGEAPVPGPRHRRPPPSPRPRPAGDRGRSGAPRVRRRGAHAVRLAPASERRPVRADRPPRAPLIHTIAAGLRPPPRLCAWTPPPARSTLGLRRLFTLLRVIPCNRV